MSIALAGFMLGISLIVAIGPQNAMIIKHGVQRDHVTLILAVCALSDVVLIFSGTAGVGYLVERFPVVLVVLKYVGAAYLAYFAFSSLRDAFARRARGLGDGPAVRRLAETEPTSAGAASTAASVPAAGARSVTKPKERTWVKPLLLALALTWLNPGAYVDVLVVLGGIANQYGPTGRWIFALGAVAASFTWFPLLGYGAVRFSGVLSRPRVWRAINLVIGLMMAGLALKLLLS